LRKIIGCLARPQWISSLKMFLLRNKLLTKLFRIRYFALNNLDKSLETFIDFNNGCFVELGANDGVN